MEPAPLPPRRRRHKARRTTPGPVRLLGFVLLLVLAALLVAGIIRDPAFRAQARAVLAQLNRRHVAMGAAGLVALLVLRRILAALVRRRPEEEEEEEEDLPLPPHPPPVDVVIPPVPGPAPGPPARRRESLGEQILFALILFTLTGLAAGAVLYLELQWYLEASPYRYLGFAALAGLGALVLAIRALRGRRRARAVPVEEPRPPRLRREARPSPREEVAVAREPARRPPEPAGRPPKPAGRPPKPARRPPEPVVAREPARQPPKPAGSPPEAAAGARPAAEAPPEQPAGETPRGPVLMLGPGRVGVGLDVGASHIKLVQVRATRRGPVVTSFGMASTPRQTVVDGVIAKPLEAAGVLRTLMADIGLNHRRVVTAVGGQGVILRHAQFPRMKEQELREVLRWEVEQYIPIPPDEAVSDFTILGDAPQAERDGKGPPKMRVLLVGTQRQMVQGILDTLRAASLYPVAIDVDAMACFRVLVANGYVPPRPRNLSTMVVDIGAASTKLSVFLDGVPQLSRTIPVAGNTMTAAAAEGLGQDMATAQQLKREFGTLPDTPIFRFLQPVLDEILLEVRRSIEFYLVRNYGQDIREIYLVGGGAGLKGLPQALADYLNVSLSERAEGEPDLVVTPVDPLRDVELHPSLTERGSRFGPQFATALGLALREEG